MSIQPGRVVARIVDEVARSPRRAFEVSCFATKERDGEILEVVRVSVASAVRGSGAAVVPSRASDTSGTPAGDGCVAPFATLFHFWTHALRGFLERRDEADQLVGIAGYGMCDAVGAASFCGDLASRLARVADPSPSEWSPIAERRIREAYRMIEGDCRRSGVAAADDEWIAWFWAHGHCGGRVHLPVAPLPAPAPR